MHSTRGEQVSWSLAVIAWGSDLAQVGRSFSKSASEAGSRVRTYVLDPSALALGDCQKKAFGISHRVFMEGVGASAVEACAAI